MDKINRYELSDIDKGGLSKIVKAFIFYELQPTSDVDKLISSLTEGVRNATRQLPFLAGDIQVDDSGKLYIMTPQESKLDITVRRFGSTQHKSLSTLAKNSFSPKDLDPTLLLPEEPADKKQACALQLSLIEGGLILGLRINHAVGDWSSIDRFLSLICQSSKAHQECSKMPTYTPDLNRSPYNTPAIDPSISRQDFLDRLPLFNVIEKSQFKMKPPPPSVSGIYKISESTIQQLKAQCAPYLSGVDYITSYDCISALIWTSITRARLHLHPEKTNSQSRFVHPIDVRSRDPENETSEKYFGNAVIGTQAGPLTAQTLVSDGDRGLAAAATLIRQSVNFISLSSIKAMTALTASLSSTEMLSLHADFTEMDMFMNSWYSGSAEQYEIGGALVPVAFRLSSAMMGACAVLLPNFSKGATRVFEVLIHLTVEEHELLRQDEEFLKYFEILV
ncbi:hypothetical protein K7432_013421 [Basidiobolus ranarum]|uniref:Transferase n=1 Tax=Basidiobolus ranarum TaxID=34480 RepID=A0ABR2VQU6_9FUNG